MMMIMSAQSLTVDPRLLIDFNPNQLKKANFILSSFWTFLQIGKLFLDFLANRKATTKDSSTSKDLEISNESSPTKTFSINSSPMMRNLRNEVPLTHPISSFSPSYIEVMPVMMTNTSTMEEKMAEMEQRVTFLIKALEEKDVKIATLMNKLE